MGGVPPCKIKQAAEVMVYEMLLILYSVVNSLTDAEGREQKLFLCLSIYLWHLMKFEVSKIIMFK